MAKNKSALHKFTHLGLFLLACIMLVMPVSQAKAKDYYGAIAVSPSTKAMGWAYDYGTKWKANQVALKKCRQYASDCKIATWFKNACGAISIGAKGGWGADWGTSTSNAKWKATKRCKQYDYNCTPKRWVCTTR